MRLSAYIGGPHGAHGHCLPQLANSDKSCTFSGAIPAPVPHGVAQAHSTRALLVQKTLINASVLAQAS